jgi:hypothetical protein
MSQNINMICLWTWTWSPILRLTNAIPIFNERTFQISLLFVLLGVTSDRVESFVPAKISDFLQTRSTIAWTPCRDVNIGIRFIWFHQMMMLNDSLLFHRSPSINYIGLHFLTTSMSERFNKRVDICLRLNSRLDDAKSSVLSLSCTRSCNYTSEIQHWTISLNTPAAECKEWSRNLSHLWTPASPLRRDAHNHRIRHWQNTCRILFLIAVAKNSSNNVKLSQFQKTEWGISRSILGVQTHRTQSWNAGF